jgi:1-pyrroline-5-carboxylate dehydrogenase
MTNAIYALQEPLNEPIYSYAPGTAERVAITSKLKELREQRIEIPVIIGGKEVHTGLTAPCVIPHNHQHPLGFFHHAGEEEVGMAVTAALDASRAWAGVPWQARLAIFKKAAELIAGPYRMLINAATVLGQGKNVFQAEIDAACEMIDFLRFNAYNAHRIFAEQPRSGAAEWNQLEYRPLEGFVYAVTPFNFTAIAGNLPSAPAMLGNTVLWKPASSAVYSAYFLMKIFQEAGLPDGVINFIPGAGSKVGLLPLENPALAGVHFTGSTGVFKQMWRTIGRNIDIYRSYPRIVGETGGKDFIFVHPSADRAALVTRLCAAPSSTRARSAQPPRRMFIPRVALEGRPKAAARYRAGSIKMGSPEDFSRTSSARSSTRKPTQIDQGLYRTSARKAREKAKIIAGGGCDDSKGYLIEPTVIRVRTNPIMRPWWRRSSGPC